jgi:hypothetical protein
MQSKDSAGVQLMSLPGVSAGKPARIEAPHKISV